MDPTAHPQPAATRLFDVPLDPKIRAVVLTRGQSVTLRWSILDADGHAVDLTDWPAFTVELRLAEATPPRDVELTATGAVADAAAGLVTAPLDTRLLQGPGIYWVALGLVTDDQALLWQNHFYLYLQRSLFQAETGQDGPPAWAELRQQLRDSARGEQRLLDEHAFDDADLAMALVRTVEDYNAMTPPLARRYSTRSFPHTLRSLWFLGASAHLLRTHAHFFRANAMAHSADGVALDDLNKYQQFDQAADRLYQQWYDQARSRKAAQNLAEGFGSSPSPYF